MESPNFKHMFENSGKEIKNSQIVDFKLQVPSFMYKSNIHHKDGVWKLGRNPNKRFSWPIKKKKKELS